MVKLKLFSIFIIISGLCNTFNCQSMDKVKDFIKIAGISAITTGVLTGLNYFPSLGVSILQSKESTGKRKIFLNAFKSAIGSGLFQIGWLYFKKFQEKATENSRSILHEITSDKLHFHALWIGMVTTTCSLELLHKWLEKRYG